MIDESSEFESSKDANASPVVIVPTPIGAFLARAVEVERTWLLVVTSQVIPVVPVVRFQSSCVFGESLRAVDCDCGAQLDAALALIVREGGILIYSWEEGRGAGIANKLRGIALQQSKGMSTAEAFAALGLQPELRGFGAQVIALKAVFKGTHIRFASDNPAKVAALVTAGFNVERIRLQIAMTAERESYVAHKRRYLGHLGDG
jgi:GTP cyclohydrolase II